MNHWHTFETERRHGRRGGVDLAGCSGSQSIPDQRKRGHGRHHGEQERHSSVLHYPVTPVHSRCPPVVLQNYLTQAPICGTLVLERVMVIRLLHRSINTAKGHNI